MERLGAVALTQLSDTPTYSKTVQFLRLHPPSTIIVPQPGGLSARGSGGQSGAQGSTTRSILIECLEDIFQQPIYPLNRKFWGVEQGTLSHLCKLIRGYMLTLLGRSQVA